MFSKIELSGSQLKWIAIISMLLDHLGAVFYPVDKYPEMVWLRIVGRLAFPIFAFLIVEGYKHTGNVKKYLFRLSLFAIISEIPYDLAFRHSIYDPDKQNVFFTLALGLLALYIFDRLKQWDITIATIAVFLIGMTAMILHTDYSIFGIVMIFGIYTAGKRVEEYSWIILTNGIMAVLYYGSGGSAIQIYAGLSVLFIALYKGEKGRGSRYLFYIIYPLHLIIYSLVDRFIN